MSKSPLVRGTKMLLDFMFYTGIAVCLTVPLIFQQAGRYFSIFREYYLPFCIIFFIAGVFALIILWELRSIFKTVVKADPFVRENVRSLKKMGVSSFCIAVMMLTRLFFIITPAALVLVAVFAIAGLFSLVLSLVFDEAVTYKQENDLTI
jgi:hypothetical protein